MKRKNNSVGDPPIRPRIKDALTLYSSNTAITLVPQEPFLDWVRSIRPGEVVEFDDLEVILYLVPDCKDLFKTEDWLMENVQQIFEDQLSLYSRNVRCWPKYRNQDVFSKWFHIALHSRVVHIRRKNLLN